MSEGLPAESSFGCLAPLFRAVLIVVVLLVLLAAIVTSDTFDNYWPDVARGIRAGVNRVGIPPGIQGPPTAAMPAISARSFTGGSGSSPVNVSGTFSLGSNLSLQNGGISDGERAYLTYGASRETGQIQMTLSSVPNEGYELTLLNGPWVALSMGNCMWDVDVTNTTLSGHVSCMDVHAENEETNEAGTVNIDLDFSANSPPEGDAADPLSR